MARNSVAEDATHIDDDEANRLLDEAEATETAPISHSTPPEAAPDDGAPPVTGMQDTFSVEEESPFGAEEAEEPPAEPDDKEKPEGEPEGDAAAEAEPEARQEPQAQQPDPELLRRQVEWYRAALAQQMAQQNAGMGSAGGSAPSPTHPGAHGSTAPPAPQPQSRWTPQAVAERFGAEPNDPLVVEMCELGNALDGLRPLVQQMYSRTQEQDARAQQEYFWNDCVNRLNAWAVQSLDQADQGVIGEIGGDLISLALQQYQGNLPAAYDAWKQTHPRLYQAYREMPEQTAREEQAKRAGFTEATRRQASNAVAGVVSSGKTRNTTLRQPPPRDSGEAIDRAAAKMGLKM